MAIETLCVIAYENDAAVFFRTPATPELLDKVERAKSLRTELVSVEGSADECVTLPLAYGTSIDAFTAVAGNVPLARLSESEFLSLTKTDGVDMFY